MGTPRTASGAIRQAREVFAPVSDGNDSMWIRISKVEARRMYESDFNFSFRFDVADQSLNIVQGWGSDDLEFKIYDSRTLRP